MSVPNEIITRNLVDFEKKTANLYESIAIIAKRSNQISAKVKEELSEKLNEFQSHSDNLEEVFENREQIEISKYYERQPKATLVSLSEFMDNKIYHRNPSKES
ncbi:MAG: DNA-directed RNA polymerase subunit omega [Bacteroidetes bacterium]|nr:DNA-directed RNA polymerase subunit omega [Bacteroidota bacterium]